MFAKDGRFIQALLRGFGAVACSWLLLAMGVNAATVEVQVKNFTFDPQTVNIQVGDTVHWTWVESGHSVTSGSGCTGDGRFDSAVRDAGFTKSVTFNRSGKVPYFCVPHCSIGMTGIVNVAGGPPPTVRNKPPTLKLTVSNNSPNKKSRILDEGETETIKAVASDADHEVVSLNATGLPAGSNWSPATGKRAVGLFTWTPAPGTAATQPVVTLVFSATDNPTNGASPLTTSQAVTLNIGQNSPPTLDAIQPPPAIVGKTLKLTVTASDADGDALKFFTTRLPAGAQFKSKGLIRGKWTGVLTWKPKRSQVGQSFPITFTVRDNFLHPLQDSEEVTFTVTSQ